MPPLFPDGTDRDLSGDPLHLRLSRVRSRFQIQRLRCTASIDNDTGGCEDLYDGRILKSAKGNPLLLGYGEGIRHDYYLQCCLGWGGVEQGVTKRPFTNRREGIQGTVRGKQS